MLNRRWLPKGTPADTTRRDRTQRNATRQDRTQRNATGQNRTEKNTHRKPPARPDNLKEVEPCLTAGGSQREHLRTRRNATRRNATRRNATRRDATQRDTTRHNATRQDTTQRDTTRRDTTRHDGKMHTLSTSIPHGWVRTPSLPIIIHFSLQKALLTPYQSPSGKKKTVNDRRSQII